MGRVLSRLIAPVWQPTTRSLRGWALASMIANAVVICTGEAVRLSSSGLGCPDWPACTKTSAVAAQSLDFFRQIPPEQVLYASDYNSDGQKLSENDDDIKFTITDGS